MGVVIEIRRPRSEVGIVLILLLRFLSLVMGTGKGLHDSLIAERGVKSRDLSWEA